MIALDSIDGFLDALNARLDQGASEYGNQSMARPVAAIVDEIRQELLDEVGWAYVLWCIAARKAGYEPRDERSLRARFLVELRHMIARNDRGHSAAAPGGSIATCIHDLQVLCMDLFTHAHHVELRLRPIARAIEVAQALEPHVRRGRRGSISDPRSSD